MQAPVHPVAFVPTIAGYLGRPYEIPHWPLEHIRSTGNGGRISPSSFYTYYDSGSWKGYYKMRKTNLVVVMLQAEKVECSASHTIVIKVTTAIW